MALFRSAILNTVLCLALTQQFPARAANGGDICTGWQALLCAPVALVEGAKALGPKPAKQHALDAMRAGDLEETTRWMKKLGDLPEKEKLSMLDGAASEYMHEAVPEKSAARLEIVKLLLQGMDMSGAAGTVVLQRAVSCYGDGFTPEPQLPSRRLVLATFVIEHGARAGAVDFGRCHRCEEDDEFLPLLARHGANLDRHISSWPLLNDLVFAGHYEAAKRLIVLGANPNGGLGPGPHSMLGMVAARCDRDSVRYFAKLQGFDEAWQECVQRSIAFTTFAVQHGADPNGLAKARATPYQLARQSGNDELAQALLQLGANPR